MRAIEENLYRVSLGLVLVMACLFGFGGRIGVGTVTMGHTVTTVVLLTLFSVFCGLKPAGRLMLCAFAACCALAVFAVAGRANVLLFARGYLLWLWGETAELPAGYVYPYLQTAAVSLGCFLFHLLASRLRRLEYIAAAAACAGLPAAMFMGREPDHMCVVFVLLYAVLVYVGWTRQGWDKQKSGGTRPFLAWILPFAAFYLLLMAVMPAPEQPYGWPLAHRIYHNLRETIETISQTWFSGNGDDFEISRLGFSEENELSGGVQKEEREVMKLSVRQRQSANLYLTGKVYDSFTGRQWRQTDTGISGDRTMDAMETVCAALYYDKNNMSAYLSSASADITYRYYHTNYLFAPLKTWSLNGENGKKLDCTQADGNILFPGRKSYGTGYTVNYIQINAGNKAFDQFLEMENQLEESSWQRVQRDYGRRGEELVGLAELEQYRARVHEVYGIPPAMSERTGEYLDRLTEHADSDMEKLRAIERELQGYGYTRTPGALPADVDSEDRYLDYFLLESRRGYCCYFATAFVLLARAEGIPARYVEGFCVPVQTEEEISVYSYMAHAWPEVYFDGIGWIPFEPTPGYGQYRYTPWNTVYDRTERPADFDRDEWEKWLENREDEEEQQQQQAQDTPEEEIQRKSSGIWKTVGYALLFYVLLNLLVLLCVSFIRRRLHARWDVGRCFEAGVQNDLQLLKLLGYRRRPWETLEELGCRVQAETERKLRFLELYEEKLYGERAADEGMLAAVREDGLWLEGQLRENRPRRYFYYRLRQIFL